MSPRVLDKESARVPRRFREKPFVVPEALEGKRPGRGRILVAIIY